MSEKTDTLYDTIWELGKKQFAYRCEYTHRVYIFKLIENGLKI